MVTKAIVERKAEMVEVARLMRIIEHCLKRLLLILPKRLEANSRVVVDLLSVYGLFKGMIAIMRLQRWAKDKTATIDDFHKEGTNRHFNLTKGKTNEN